MLQKTLVLLKPDAVKKHHIGDIMKIYESNGLEVKAMKMMLMDEKVAAQHYAEHVERPFYPELVEFMTSGPIIAMVLQGEDAIANVRTINGKTNPANAAEGTIRKLYAENGSINAVHASDSPESAAREISIFFNAMEIMK